MTFLDGVLFRYISVMYEGKRKTHLKGYNIFEYIIVYYSCIQFELLMQKLEIESETP